MICPGCNQKMKCTYSVPLYSKKNQKSHLRYRMYTCQQGCDEPLQATIELPAYVGRRLRFLRRYYDWGYDLWKGMGRYLALAKPK